MRHTLGIYVLGIAILLVVSVVWGLSTYSGDIYAVDRANGFVDIAAATNNLTEALNDLNQTMALLAPLHGNPNPIFPTAHTNIDAIKAQIQATIDSGIKVLGATPDSFAYQQALHNIQSDLTTTIANELSDTSGAMLWWSFSMWDIILWLVYLIGVGFLLVYYSDSVY